MRIDASDFSTLRQRVPAAQPGRSRTSAPEGRPHLGTAVRSTGSPEARCGGPAGNGFCTHSIFQADSAGSCLGEAWRSVAGSRRRPGAQGPAGGGIPGGAAGCAGMSGPRRCSRLPHSSVCRARSATATAPHPASGRGALRPSLLVAAAAPGRPRGCLQGCGGPDRGERNGGVAGAARTPPPPGDGGRRQEGCRRLCSRHASPKP